MAKHFTRNIRNTKCKGKDQEPLETNEQNDLLNDEHDVYIRNKNYYHCLTNAIQKIESKNDAIKVSKKDKNTAVLEFTRNRVSIDSITDYIDVEKKDENVFVISAKKLESELENIKNKIENLDDGEVTGPNRDFLGGDALKNYFNVEYDFDYFYQNDKILNIKADDACYVHFEYQQQYNRDVGLINIETGNSCLGENPIRINDIRTIRGLQPLTAYNIDFKITNNTKVDRNLVFQHGLGHDEKVKLENGSNYEGEFIISAKSTKTIISTYYTDENGKLLYIFIDEY